MRKKIVAGNWKMNTALQEGIALAKEIEQLVHQNPSEVIVMIAPPFTNLTEVKKQLNKVALGAQNCATEPSGAYTGEVSVSMLTSVGVSYVIIGHSERRSYYGETNAIVGKKVALALNNKLIPVFCCGEVLKEREANIHFKIVQEQVEEALFNLRAEEMAKVVIAYEPVWAIGTGVTATADQAQEMHKFIRDLLAKKYGQALANEISILYGGSCKPSNARELFSNPDVDGGLIGGASLKAQDFIGIIQGF